VRLVLIGSIEDLLKQIAVRCKSHTRPVGYIRRQIKQSVAIMMLRDLHKVLRASVCEKVDPFFRIEDGSCEVLYEIVVDYVWAVGLEVVLPGLILFPWSLVLAPPVPLGVGFWMKVSTVEGDIRLHQIHSPFSPEFPQPGTL